MVQFPNCKINLGLNILQKRADGYHDLQTVFYPLPLQDALEFVPSKQLNFTTSGIDIPGSNADNLVLKAYLLLKAQFPNLPPIDIYLLKIIPTGAGLGGGSADAAFMLMMINKYFQLQISKSQLLAYALQLGSDCPFFIYNIPCMAAGRGELLQPIQLNLADYAFVLVKPNLHIKTSWAFSQITPGKPTYDLKKTIQQPIIEWRGQLKNDFEPAIFKHFPELKKIKESLYNLGACYSALSGSGSTMFGIFEKEQVNKLALLESFKDAEVIFIPITHSQ